MSAAAAAEIMPDTDTDTHDDEDDPTVAPGRKELTTEYGSGEMDSDDKFRAWLPCCGMISTSRLLIRTCN